MMTLLEQKMILFDLEKEWEYLVRSSEKVPGKFGFTLDFHFRKRLLLCLLYPQVIKLLEDLELAVEEYLKNKSQLGLVLNLQTKLRNEWGIQTIHDLEHPQSFSLAFVPQEKKSKVLSQACIVEFDLEQAIEESQRGFSAQEIIESYNEKDTLLAIDISQDDKLIMTDLQAIIDRLRSEHGVGVYKSKRQTLLEERQTAEGMEYSENDFYILKLAMLKKSNLEIAEFFDHFYNGKKTISSNYISSRKWKILNSINSYNSNWPDEKKYWELEFHSITAKRKR